MATVKAPANAAAVPKSEMPPEVPVGTLLKFKIDRGSDFDSTPISVAQVSAVAAATDIKKSKIKMDS